MSLKTRGQEVLLKISVDGRKMNGSGTKIYDWTATPRTDLKEDDFLGENTTDLDIQHHGWDLKFSVTTIDSEILDLIDDIIAREELHEPHPDITITAFYTFREPGRRGRIYVYNDVFLKADEEGSGGRKENHKVTISGKAKRRSAIAA